MDNWLYKNLILAGHCNYIAGSLGFRPNRKQKQLRMGEFQDVRTWIIEIKDMFVQELVKGL